MSEHHHAVAIPRFVLIGAAAIMLLAIGLSAGARQVHLMRPAPLSMAIESIDVRFEDRKDGSIAVLDATTEREISIVPPRTNGFIRGVLRGMFRTRKLESIGRQARFRLAQERDGGLSLTDPQTGRRIDLDSFGPTNHEAFARIFTAGRQATR